MVHTRNIAKRYSLMNYEFLSPNKKTKGYVPMWLKPDADNQHIINLLQFAFPAREFGT
jgi:hypothetical protein